MVTAVEKNKAEKGEEFWKGVTILNSVVLPKEVTDLKEGVMHICGKKVLGGRRQEPAHIRKARVAGAEGGRAELEG